jgi:hypothetical protein
MSNSVGFYIDNIASSSASLSANKSVVKSQPFCGSIIEFCLPSIALAATLAGLGPRLLGFVLFRAIREREVICVSTTPAD